MTGCAAQHALPKVGIDLSSYLALLQNGTPQESLMSGNNISVTIRRHCVKFQLHAPCISTSKIPAVPAALVHAFSFSFVASGVLVSSKISDTGRAGPNYTVYMLGTLRTASCSHDISLLK